MIKINETKTSDLGFILTDLKLSEPTPKYNFVSLPAGDGTLDLTEALGTIKYNDRTLQASFLVEDYFNNNYDSFLNLNQGKLVRISLDDEYYLLGRLTVKELTRYYKRGLFNIQATCKPYKLKQNITVVNVSLNGTEEVILENERMESQLTIETDAPIQVVFSTNSYSVNEGTFKLPIVLVEGDNEIQLTGTANVILSYQEGVL